MDASDLQQADLPADLPVDPDDIETAFGPMFVRDDVEEPEPEPEPAAATDLDERAHEDLTGLLYLGYLAETVPVAGHRFALHTPTHNERIERAALHREYLGSMNTEPMWRLLTVAAYCVAIDDCDAPAALNPKAGEVAARLDWIKRTVFSSVMIEKLFDECLVLDARERAVVDYMDEQTKS